MKRLCMLHSHNIDNRGNRFTSFACYMHVSLKVLLREGDLDMRTTSLRETTFYV